MKLILACICVILLEGCMSFSYFQPSPTILPSVTRKGELQLAVGGGGSNHFSGFSGQAVYALSDDFLVGANGFYGLANTQVVSDYFDTSTNKQIKDAVKLNGNIYQFEGMFGFYRDYLKHFTFFAMAIYSNGKVYNNYSIDVAAATNGGYTGNYTGLRSDKFNKFGIMPGINMHSRFMDIAAGVRLSYCRFYNIINNAPHTRNTDFEHDLDKMITDPSYLILEPAIAVRFGYKNIKLFVQATGLGFLEDKSPFPYDNSIAVIGLNFGIRKANKEHARPKQSHPRDKRKSVK